MSAGHDYHVSRESIRLAIDEGMGRFEVWRAMYVRSGNSSSKWQVASGLVLRRECELGGRGGS